MTLALEKTKKTRCKVFIEVVTTSTLPKPVKMTGTCQGVKESCNLFIESQLTSFLVLYNFAHVFKIFTAYPSI